MLFGGTAVNGEVFLRISQIKVADNRVIIALMLLAVISVEYSIPYTA